MKYIIMSIVVFILVCNIAYNKGHEIGYRQAREATSILYEKAINERWTSESVQRYLDN